MEQAKARNPGIKLAALPWGAPHWVGNGDYWSQDMIGYMIKWLKHAKSDHHLTIDYVGGRNEKGYNVQWYKDFKAALRANGLSSIKVVASDDWPENRLWAIATEMKNDPALNDAIDVVGAHGPGSSGYPTPDAASLGKPLWDGTVKATSMRSCLSIKWRATSTAAMPPARSPLPSTGRLSAPSTTTYFTITSD